MLKKVNVDEVVSKDGTPSVKKKTSTKVKKVSAVKVEKTLIKKVEEKSCCIKVIQTKSFIGRKDNQFFSLKALGLGKIGSTRVLSDRPEIRGLVNRVKHLVKVEKFDG